VGSCATFQPSTPAAPKPSESAVGVAYTAIGFTIIRTLEQVSRRTQHSNALIDARPSTASPSTGCTSARPYAGSTTRQRFAPLLGAIGRQQAAPPTAGPGGHLFGAASVANVVAMPPPLKPSQ
jgi:hypothetical protein